MDVIALIVSLLVLIPSSILVNRWKRNYRNSKALLLIQFSWLLICVVAFFFIAPNFTRTQNTLIGAIFGGALVFFFYRFRMIFFNDSDH